MVAIDRFYRAYVQYCTSYNEDTLFQLLNSLHSLNDQLKNNHNTNLFDIPEFITLKAVRNYLHHEGNVHEKIVLVPISDSGVSSDLMNMCLFETRQLDQAILEIDNRYRTEQEKAIKETVHYYGDYVNIAPAIFNVAAAVMVKLLDKNIEGDSPEFLQVKDAVIGDINMGVPIRVSGRISCLVGDIGEIVKQIYSKMRSK